MTQEEFIKILKEKGYSYKMEGDKIIVTHRGHVNLRFLTSLPPGVEFKNMGDVFLDSLTGLPSDMEFINSGYVYLSGLKILPPDVKFENKGSVILYSLTTIPPGVHFENGGNVRLSGLGWVNDNKGIGIEGVENKRLLLMIKKELFI